MSQTVFAPSSPHVRDAVPPRQKSLAVAYVLWMTLGIFGAHRFYLGRWFTGLIYGISLGCYFCGWALDLLLLPWLVRQTNERLRREDQAYGAALREGPTAPVAQREEALPGAALEVRPLADEEVIATGPPEWARERSTLRPAEYTLQLAYFALAPCFFTVMALMLELWQLLAIMVAALVVVGLIGGVDALLRRHPTLRKVPGLDKVLGPLQRTTEFYRQNKPGHFIYYLLYPISGPLTALSSLPARRELKTFARITGGLTLVVLAPIGLSYFSVYPPHLGVTEALTTLFFYAIMVPLLVSMFLVPTVTTALTFHATHCRVRLRVLVILGLVSALPMGIAYFAVSGALSFTSAQLLDMRLDKASFQDELTEATTMIFHHWQQRFQGQGPGVVEMDKELTAQFQRHVGGRLPGNEAKAFRVLAWSMPGKGYSQRWLALAVQDGPTASTPHRLLLVAGPDGQMYSRWADLPPNVQARFTIGSARVATPEMIRSRNLLGDGVRKKG